MTVNIESAESEKKIIGRPPVGRKGRPLQLYATDEFIAALDEWRAQQLGIPGRSEAIRRLVAFGLEAEAEAAKKGRRK